MDNVPSSAILAIIAIVAACILGAFIFSTVNSQQDAGNRALSQTEQMNTALDESKYTVYDGATVTGSQVLSAIKTFKNGDIYIKVSNGSGDAFYIFRSDSVEAGNKQSDEDYSTAVAAAKNKGNSETYITPSAQFQGKVARDDKNGAIVGLIFEKVGSSGAAGTGTDG